MQDGLRTLTGRLLDQPAPSHQRNVLLGAHGGSRPHNGSVEYTRPDSVRPGPAFNRRAGRGRQALSPLLYAVFGSGGDERGALLQSLAPSAKLHTRLREAWNLKA
jgi:hypothetical protein